MLWESIAEETCTMDCTSFQMSPPLHNNNSNNNRHQTVVAHHSVRRSIMCNSAAAAAVAAAAAASTEMIIDNLSFYDDAHQRQTNSPVLMGLLSPEGSPHRFHIVQQKQQQHQNLHQHQLHQLQDTEMFLQPLVESNRPEKLNILSHHNHPTTETYSKMTTTKRCLHAFNSLSSTGSMESSTGSMDSSIDDEFMELFAMENANENNNNHHNIIMNNINNNNNHHNCNDEAFNLPSNLNSLISGQIKNAHASPLMPSLPSSSSTTSSSSSSVLMSHKTPEMRRPAVRRCLSMTENTLPKTPELMLNQNETAINQQMPTIPYNSCFKRPDPPSSVGVSPVQSKRHRFVEKENCSVPLPPMPVPPTPASAVSVHHHPPLRKCMSMNDAEIMTALSRGDNKDEPELIGDFSKTYVLPLMEGRHRDLKSISSETVARLLRGDFDDRIASYKIIDCRYPYEYEGGHIHGAKNLYTQEQIMGEFLTTQKTQQQQQNNTDAGHKRNIIIFHCEFSSERGPKMSRFLRNIDRERNTNAYPSLDYPEVYLLHNGYKEFFETHIELCEPEAYRPMLEPSFNEAYRHFRAKSKSWNGDGAGGAATGRMKKSRSRLML